MIAATMFSGIGAPECAMPHWDWRWCAEIEKFPSAVLKARHPESVNLGDVNAEDFIARAESVSGRPDVIVFGSPCQDFSVAGRRVGLDGDRGNLALVALGVINRLRPRWVAFENVPGLLSSRSGSAAAEGSLRDRIEHGTGRVGESSDGEEDSDFAAFLALVQQCGYLGCYRITDAQYAGVPQRRRRIFAVFHLGDWRPAAAVLFEPEGLRGDRPPSRETGEGAAGTISSRSTGGGSLGTDFKRSFAFDEVAPTLRSGPTAGKSHGKLNGSDRMPLIGVPDGPDGAVSSKWAKGSGGPASDECYNLVADVAPTLTSNGNDTGGSRFPGTNVDDAAGGSLVVVSTVTAFEPRERGDDGRGYNRSPNFSENVSPALGTVKAPVIAFDCKAGGETSFGVGDQAGTLRAAHGGGHAAVAMNLRGRDGGAMPETSGVASLRSPSGGSSRSFVFKPSHFTRDKDGAPDRVSPPLSADADKGDQDPVLMTGTAVRRLTPRECERLQAFKDDYTMIEHRGVPAADGPRYKALGNAMNVLEIQWVLQRIERFEKEKASW